MAKSRLSRRSFGRLAAGSALAAPFVRGAHAAGKLSIGMWDHWVPGANKASTELINEWAAKEKVDVSVDYITSQGFKLRLTLAAEAQARSGHDVLMYPTWEVGDKAKLLEPVDDIMVDLVKEHGKPNATSEYLGKSGGKWLCVPFSVGSQIKGPCSRIDMLKQHAGIDILAMYPAGSAPKADAWNVDTFMKAAEACHKAGVPFGIGTGQTSDSVDTAGAFFQAFGASVVDAKGNITVKTDAVKQALEFYKKLNQFLPPEAAAFDDATNNKLLIAGKTALIMNPPSAWAVAKRDAPQICEQLWTHGFPAGPKGRFCPSSMFFIGMWNFGKNKTAGKSLIRHLSTRSAVEKMTVASGGYDLPAFEKLTDFKVWQEEGPPKGTLYHYPNPHNHQIVSIAAAPAPHKIAQQIYSQALHTGMIVRYAKGDMSLEKTLDWAATELEGYMRT